jgi:tetratricopeptide (TPR) repeat protein
MCVPAVVALWTWRTVRPLVALSVAATTMLLVGSGGRTLWVAALMAAVAVALRLGVVRKLSRSKWLVAATLAGLLLGGTGLLFFSQRLLATSTIELRTNIWGASLASWTESPLWGSGPGTFPHVFAATGYYNSYSGQIPHAHNALIQALFEGGVVGLLAVSILVVAISLTAARSRPPWSVGAVAGLTFFAASTLTANPSTDGFLVSIAIVWAAFATPRVRRRGEIGERQRRLRAASLLLASVVGVGSATTVVSAFAYEVARGASEEGSPVDVIAALRLAAAVDPTFAMYHRDLGFWLASGSQLSEAETELQTALRLNPYDTQTLRSLALVAAQQGKPEAAIRAAKAAASLAMTDPQNSLTLSLVARLSGDQATAFAAVTDAVRWAPWLTAAPEWGQVYAWVDERAVIAAAEKSWEGVNSSRSSRRRAWLAGMAGADVPAGADRADLLLLDVLGCKRAQAREELSRMSRGEAAEIGALEARALYEAAFTPTSRMGRILLALRDPGRGGLAFHEELGASPTWDYSHDTRFYDRVPIPAPVGPVLPTTSSGLSAWLRSPQAAAAIGAPASALRDCSADGSEVR